MKILQFNKLELEMKLYMKSKCVQYKMTAVGFEPTPPKRLVPKTSDLDRSATLPKLTEYLAYLIFLSKYTGKKLPTTQIIKVFFS